MEVEGIEPSGPGSKRVPGRPTTTPDTGSVGADRMCGRPPWVLTEEASQVSFPASSNSKNGPTLTVGSFSFAGWVGAVRVSRGQLVVVDDI